MGKTKQVTPRKYSHNTMKTFTSLALAYKTPCLPYEKLKKQPHTLKGVRKMKQAVKKTKSSQKQLRIKHIQTISSKKGPSSHIVIVEEVETKA